MSPKLVLHGAGLLSLIAFVGVVWHRNPPEAFYGGLPYLVAALFVNQGCVISFVAAEKESRRRNLLIVPVLQTRAQVFFLSAWQLAILGVLNICAYSLTGLSAFLLSNLLLVTWIGISYRLIALADRSDQQGGYKPLRPFGRERSRRFSFWVCIVYPLSPIVIAGGRLFFQPRLYPPPLHPPQISLLDAALFSVGTAALVFPRYRKVPSRRDLTVISWLMALFVAGFAGIFMLIWSSSLYVYIISSISALCTVLMANGLLRADWGRAEGAVADTAVTTGSSGNQAAG